MTANPWRSRGYLPHFDKPQAIQSITFRLADSLPAQVLKALASELRRLKPEQYSATKRERLDFYLDSGLGSCILADPAAAEKVQDALLHFAPERYRLLAWVIMPNHVHILVETMEAWSLARIVQSWKSFTARWIRANEHTLTRRFLGQVEAEALRGVWQRDYWDRYIRDDDHFAKVVEYIHQNPVKAGLTSDARLWRWSSAYDQEIAGLAAGGRRFASG